MELTTSAQSPLSAVHPYLPCFFAWSATIPSTPATSFCFKSRPGDCLYLGCTGFHQNEGKHEEFSSVLIFYRGLRHFSSCRNSCFLDEGLVVVGTKSFQNDYHGFQRPQALLPTLMSLWGSWKRLSWLPISLLAQSRHLARFQETKAAISSFLAWIFLYKILFTRVASLFPCSKVAPSRSVERFVLYLNGGSNTRRLQTFMYLVLFVNGYNLGCKQDVIYAILISSFLSKTTRTGSSESSLQDSLVAPHCLLSWEQSSLSSLRIRQCVGNWTRPSDWCGTVVTLDNSH